MPYKNAYNENIARQLRNIDQQHVNRIEQISETNKYDVATPMEHTTLHDDSVKGGGGFRAATVQDLGFEPTNGATPAQGGAKKGGSKTSRKGAGVSAGASGALPNTSSVDAEERVGTGMSAGGVITGGMALPVEAPPAEVTKAKRAKRAKLPAPPHQTDNVTGGALLTLQDLDKMKGQPADAPIVKKTPKAGVGEVKGETPAPLEGAGKKTRSRAASDRNILVRKIMAEHKLSLPAASKYIKEHNLYKT